MTLNVYLVDDAADPMELLGRYIERIPWLHLVGMEQDPEKALAYLLGEGMGIHLVLLDIEMPGLSGLDIARSLAGRQMVIFTTGHRQFGPEAYELKAVDYLLKPVGFTRFLEAAGKARQVAISASAKQTITGDTGFYIPGDGKGALIRLEKSDILYVKSAGNYLEVVTRIKTYKTFLSITDVEEQPQGVPFVRIHRSYLISMNHISKIETYSVIMKDNTELPISNTYRDHFMALVNAFRLQRLL